MEIIWEDIESHSGWYMKRAKVPGGWLIVACGSLELSITFYPDPDHEWDGNSLP